MTGSHPLTAPPHANVRMMQLDVLRGIAILMVLLRHPVVEWTKAGIMRASMLFLWKIGWTGVDLFFVLSGFLIGGLLFKEILKTGRLDVKRFFIRRGLKIWPPYCLLIIALFFRLLFEHKGIRGAFITLVPNLIHLQNYMDQWSHGHHYASLRGHTWSLAVVEHLYLALPIFLLLLTRRWKNVNALSMIPFTAIATSSSPARPCGSSPTGIAPSAVGTHQYPTHLRIDGLFFGVLFAYLYHMKPALLGRIAHHKWALLIFGLLLVLPMGFFDIDDHRWMWTIGFTMLYVGYGCILLACVYTALGDGPLGSIIFSLPARLLAWIGLFSYSIYLWQADLGSIPTRHWIMPHLPQQPTSLNWALSTALYLVVTILAGIVMSKLIEMPILALRDRLFPGRIPIPTRPAPHDSPELAIAVAMDQQRA